MKKILVLFLSVFLICGCQKKERKNEIRLSVNMNPHTLDPRKSGDIVSDAVIRMFFSGLTKHTKDKDTKLALAKSLKISKDKKTYTFKIKEDAKWSDGKPITAKDFENSWKKLIDPDFPSLCRILFYPILNAEEAANRKVSLDEVGIYAKDEKTLIVKLKNPTPYFLHLTSFSAFFPVPTHVVEKYPNWENNIKTFICSGPFTLKKYDLNNEIIGKKNPFHWNTKNVSLNQVHISIIPNETTTLQMFENGELDWVGSYSSPLPVDSIPTILKKKEHNILPIGGTTFCTFNIERFPFNNKNIRKALGLAINRKKIVENITQAKELIATRCIPPVIANNRNFKLYEDNDIEAAKVFFKKGLEELKIQAKDLDITFSYGTDIVHKKQAEAIQETWQKTFNIKIKLEQLEEQVIKEKLHKHNYQSALFYWLAHYPDPMNIFDRFKYKKNIKNYPNWENKEYIKLLDEAAKQISEEKRMELLEKAEKIFMDDMPISPIYHHNYITLTKDYVENLYMGKNGNLNIDEVKINKKYLK